MRNAEASDAARRLAAARWTPAARLRSAVATVVSRAADLDDDQRAAVEAAVTNGGDDDE